MKKCGPDCDPICDWCIYHDNLSRNRYGECRCKLTRRFTKPEHPGCKSFVCFQIDLKAMRSATLKIKEYCISRKSCNGCPLANWCIITQKYRPSSWIIKEFIHAVSDRIVCKPRKFQRKL